MDSCNNQEVHIEIADGVGAGSPPGVRKHLTYVDKDGVTDRTELHCKKGDYVKWCTNSGKATFDWSKDGHPFASAPPGADKACRAYEVVDGTKKEYKYTVILDDQASTIYRHDPKVIIAGGGLNPWFFLSPIFLLLLAGLYFFRTSLFGRPQS